MNRLFSIYFLINFILSLLIFSCLFFIFCKDNSDQNIITEFPYQGEHFYKFRWSANPEPDMSHYYLFAWNGDDTTNSPFTDNSSAHQYMSYRIKQIPHISSSTNIMDTVAYVANGNWLHFAVAAVNQQGGISKIGTSNFLKSEDLTRLDYSSPN
jgi:hypothetical protein